MSRTALQVSGLSKRYRLGEYSADTHLREVIINALGRLLHRKRTEPKEVWALNDVSFTVQQGEVLGIVGRNGAGKSTLLKLLSRITYPTSGSLKVRGRVASLLEVGTGFHDELTGRENIYLNGSILGMKKKEIDRHLDAIVDFSGVERFIDTPIKRYSSGMRLRLGFSVAAHLSPDVLLVDEVLAVGDADFQKKCLDTMDELRTGGRTVLFVSHNMAAIESLCSRCIWVEGGSIRADGEARTVVSDYLKTCAQVSVGAVDFEHFVARTGNGDCKFTRLEFLDSDGETGGLIRSGKKVTLRLHYRAHKSLRDLLVEVSIHSEFGALIATSNNWMTGDDIPTVRPGTGFADLVIDCLYLLPGRYYLSLSLGKWNDQQDLLKNCVAFEVEPSDYYGTGRGINSRFGMTFLPARWESHAP